MVGVKRSPYELWRARLRQWQRESINAIGVCVLVSCYPFHRRTSLESAKMRARWSLLFNLWYLWRTNPDTGDFDLHEGNSGGASVQRFALVRVRRGRGVNLVRGGIAGHFQDICGNRGLRRFEGRVGGGVTRVDVVKGGIREGPFCDFLIQPRVAAEILIVALFDWVRGTGDVGSVGCRLRGVVELRLEGVGSGV